MRNVLYELRTKGIIVYNGKYGSTKQYAEWLGEKLNLSTITSDDISGEQLANYNFIILGSAVYFGKLLLSKWFEQNLSFLNKKKLFLFIVNGTPPNKPQLLESYIQNSVPPEIRNEMEVYFFPGRLNLKSLSWFHPFMLRVGAWFEKDPASKKRMLTGYNDMHKHHTTQLESSVDNFCNVPVWFN
jgi:menaquinone-dependent protoporphyrinogen IX oxidase